MNDKFLKPVILFSLIMLIFTGLAGSVAAGTALVATGYKTNNGVVGQLPDGCSSLDF
jgi:hypothetical protein